MENLKHTPAPWEYVGGDNWSVEINIRNATVNLDRRYKNTDEVAFDRSTMEANGKLIACAPELLEALIAISEWDKRNEAIIGTTIINKVNSAIKKADQA
jgi:hypothetical protein